MSHQATWPPATRLRVICDLIPQWPIDLVLDDSLYVPGTVPPPIKVGDLLAAIHRTLHERITHDDWGRLTEEQVVAVSRAYTRRCRMLPQHEMTERKDGVKKVDFLLKNVWFRGLVPTTDPTVVKLIVGA